MQGAVAALANRGDDVGMVVADGRAHLPGGEVEDLRPLGVPHVAALRLLDDLGVIVAAVADEVFAEFDGHGILSGISTMRGECPVAARKRSSSACGRTIVA